MVKDARDLDNMFSFDKILLDAPCSGSGTIFEGDKDLDKRFTTENIERFVKTQKKLIEKAYKLLKPGGELVYSTCSILKEENEEVVSAFFEDYKTMKIVPISFEGIDEITRLPVNIEGTICICPDKKYEGFFIAKMKKGK